MNDRVQNLSTYGGYGGVTSADDTYEALGVSRAEQEIVGFLWMGRPAKPPVEPRRTHRAPYVQRARQRRSSAIPQAQRRRTRHGLGTFWGCFLPARSEAPPLEPCLFFQRSSPGKISPWSPFPL